MHISCKRFGLFVPGLLFLSLSVLVVGCGKGGSTVSGKVTYKGETLKRGVVQFFPEGAGGSFTSPIKSDGTYSIPNVPRGMAKISVISGSAKPPDQMMKGRGGMGGARAAKGMQQQREKMAGPPGGASGADASEEGPNVPTTYNDPEQSGLKVEVTGGKQTHDITIQ
jgi:hypothetical protein